MRRGTTPTIKIKLKGCDINNLEKIYVTFQDETLQLDAMKNVLIQVRAKTKDENVIASNIKSVPVEDILKEGMI